LGWRSGALVGRWHCHGFRAGTLVLEEESVLSNNPRPMSVPEPTEIAMLPPDPDADESLPISKVPLSPALAVPVLNDRSPDTPVQDPVWPSG
jgi:hypothetical protein